MLAFITHVVRQSLIHTVAQLPCIFGLSYVGTLLQTLAWSGPLQALQGDLAFLDKTLSSTVRTSIRTATKIEDLARHIWQLHLDGRLPNDKFEVVPRHKPPPAGDENLILTFRLGGPDEDVCREMGRKTTGCFLRTPKIHHQRRRTASFDHGGV
ncbi:hypothetical protein KFL_008630020 [Klebsormidium nitens]|uniref:Uncharacterized protein n=1 Tax=Klebsormidium nitens TaxID=105231 RepID=A0A1Y1ILZ8_KLENI|nr:hypothetical protein KFL_008630020 [Klebsormidium nitens]|eukprot:GAQ91824.1 hypothetical protein KFL_008630020 [Klebsormidium nitens]